MKTCGIWSYPLSNLTVNLGKQHSWNSYSADIPVDVPKSCAHQRTVRRSGKPGCLSPAHLDVGQAYSLCARDWKAQLITSPCHTAITKGETTG